MRASGTANTNGAGEYRIGTLSANQYRFWRAAGQLKTKLGLRHTPQTPQDGRAGTEPRGPLS
jgi:hypothetical protein